MKIQFWKVDPIWKGETVAILGGGPSLTRAQVDACRGKCRVIAVNTAYQIAPWADLLYWCDHEWFGWHRASKEFAAFAGIKVALQNSRTWPSEPHIRVLQNYGGPPERQGLCPIPDGVYTGRNSGAQAINVAAHLGAARILMLAFDMRAHGAKTHWHMNHRRPTAANDFQSAMLPWFPAIKVDLDKRGIVVVNCTPGSALTVFPMTSIDAALVGDPQLAGCVS